MAPKKRKRIGLFGGSFNPPHVEHLNAAKKVYETLDLDGVWMLVTPQNPLKDPADYAPLEHRMAMCNLLAQNYDWLEPTDIEKNFESTETADTLRQMQALYPDIDFVWVMGADNLTHFHKWARWKYIMENFSIVVLQRPGDGEFALDSIAAKYGQHLREADPKKLGGNKAGWCFIQTDAMAISSSKIRKDFSAGKQRITGLFNSVANYIRKHGLYQPKPPAP